LDLAGNYFYAEGFALLSAALVQTPAPGLRHLDLEDNAATAEGAFLFGEALSRGALPGLQVGVSDR
jgi:hypothetical protein